VLECQIPPASLFYPGVRERSNAHIIQLVSVKVNVVVPLP